MEKRKSAIFEGENGGNSALDDPAAKKACPSGADSGTGTAMSSEGKDLSDFEAAFEAIRSAVLAEFSQEFELSSSGRSLEYISRMIEHTVVGGKMNRGIFTVIAAQLLSPEGSCSEEERASSLRKAQIAGWCVEWLQAYLLVEDDVMDHSVLRRGKPCWYTMPGIGFSAINDGLLLEGMVFRIAKIFFSKEAYYVDFFHLLQQVNYQTQIGQLLDMASEQRDGEGRPIVERFTLEGYFKIIKYKTIFYSFYLPVALGMLLSGFRLEANADSFKEAYDACHIIGEYFQVQDDLLDCYGTKEQIGKVGRDIEEGKCTWLAARAMELLREEGETNEEAKAQIEILRNNLGKEEAENVEKVKRVYSELKLKEAFAAYEEKCLENIRRLIRRADENDGSRGKKLNGKLFEQMWSKIYKRAK